MKVLIYVPWYSKDTSHLALSCSEACCAFIPLLQLEIVYVLAVADGKGFGAVICGGSHTTLGQVMAQFSQRHKTIRKLPTEDFFSPIHTREKNCFLVNHMSAAYSRNYSDQLCLTVSV